MPRGRPRQFNTEKALDKALMLFWRRGYEGTSLAALRDAMGINMPSLYAAFGNKEHLFSLAIERYLQKPASYLPRALEEPDARQAMEKLFQGAIDMVMNPKHPDGCLLVHGALAAGPEGEPIRRELARRRGRAQRVVHKRLDHAVAHGQLPAGTDTAKLARYFVTVLWGLSVQAAGGASRKQLEEVARHAMESWPSSRRR